MDNNIRQILMNELGLTRDVVRHEAALIIAETLDRKFNEDWLRQLEDRLEARILKGTSYWDRDKVVQKAVDRAIEKIGVELAGRIIDKLKVKVEVDE